MTIKALSGGLLAAFMTLQGASAQNAPPTNPDNFEDQILDCITEAVSAIDLPNALPYMDEDGGYKKYIENETTLIGVTTYLNPYGENIDTVENAVHLMSKVYHEGSEESFDFSRTVQIRFTEDGVHHIDHGFTLSGRLFDGFDAPPRDISELENDITNWTNDSANTLSLVFSVCMNFEPYEVGGWANLERPIQPPEFPSF